MSFPRVDPNTLIEVGPAELDSVTQFYDRGLYLQAYEAAQKIGPLTQWTGASALLLASRLAGNLAASRLSRWLVLRAYRLEPRNLEAIYFYVTGLWRRGGAFRAWRLLESLDVPADGPVTDRANLLGLRARLASEFRDSETANRLLDEADALNPDNPWLRLDRAYCLEEQDDYEGALAGSRRVLEARPWFRPAVQAVAYHLQLLSRDEEALELLRAAMSRMESEAVAAQLAALESELGLFTEARETLQRYRELAPLIEGREQEWWDALMCDVQYHLGHLDEAVAHARQIKGPFYEKLAARMSQPHQEPKRVHLAVKFVRQHRMTCAPATISALSHFWQVPVDHLSLAAAICYDGTPDHVERHWAEQNGWAVAEFKVTWDAAVALLDRSMPFTVSTVQTESAHLQAIVGYDRRLGTLLVRDPYERFHREIAADWFLERYAPNGPRGMVLWPKDRENLLEGIELPETELYASYYQLRRALERHDRKSADACLEQLKQAGATHRLVWQGKRSLALYDANEVEMLAATEELLKQFPENTGMLSLSKLASLRELGRRRETIAFLHEKTAGKEAEPPFLREYARELLEDASQRDTTRRLLLRAMRSRPVDADNLHVLAGLRWEERNFPEAAQLYRLAACVADKTEYLFRSYFTAARQIGETGDAIAWLRRRFEQFGKRSGLPARTLFWALSNVDRGTEAFAILDEALLLRPEDGDLLTFAADEYARIGRLERAMELLTAAHGRASRAAWLRTSGTIAENESKLKRALQVWREVLALEPLAMDANRAVARLLAEVDGRAAALEHLREVCARFSHHVQLHKLWLEWTKDPDDREKILQLLLSLTPDDGWSHREMALLLADKGRFGEAHRELQAARRVEPLAPSSHMVAGRVLYLEGKATEAIEAYRRAISLSVDSDAAVEGLLAACPGFQEKQEALDFIFQELKRQVSLGDGLLAYRDAAYPILEPQALLDNLREALSARPDLWHAWSAVTAQLRVMKKLDEALELARQASARFPLLPRIWYDLAQVHKARREPKDEIAALERALQTNPAWGFASRELSSAYERLGNVEAAEAVVVKAIAAAPSDAFNHGFLGDISWRKGERKTAIAEIERAIILDPNYDWAWQVLRDWSVQEGGENLALQAARDLVATRSGESRSWLRLAEALSERDDFAERLSAVDRALALNPRSVEAWDVRASVLAGEKRYQEALASCRPAPFAENPPAVLRGRAAWIEAERGRLDEAVKQMRAVVEEAPDYYWGWARLADWYGEQKQPALALAAAEQMSRLQPENEAVLAYIGEAQLALDRRKEAREAFRRAWDLNPLYAYGGGKLFDLALEDRNFQDAETILERMKRHLDDPQVVANEVRQAAAQADRKRAFTVLEQLCRRKGEISYSLVTLANNALVDAGWGRAAERFLFKMLAQEGVNPEVGTAWVKQLTYRTGWRWWRGVHRLRVETPAQKEALRSLINAIGDEKRIWLLRYLLWRRGADLLRDDAAWGNVTYALAHSGEFRRTIRWMEDWRSRPKVQPWMLLNLATSFDQCARDNEAREVSLAALELPVDHSTGAHCLWLACDAAIRGNFSDAERYQTAALEGPPQEHTEVVTGAVEAMLSLHRTPPHERSTAVKAIRARLREKVAAVGRLDPGSRRMYRRTLLRLAQDSGNRWGTVDAWLRTLPRPRVPPAMWPVIRIAIVLLIIFRRVWWPSVTALFHYLRNLVWP